VGKIHRGGCATTIMESDVCVGMNVCVCVCACVSISI